MTFLTDLVAGTLDVQAMLGALIATGLCGCALSIIIQSKNT